MCYMYVASSFQREFSCTQLFSPCTGRLCVLHFFPTWLKVLKSFHLLVVSTWYAHFDVFIFLLVGSARRSVIH